MMLNSAVYYAEPGYNYLVQHPTGRQLGEPPLANLDFMRCRKRFIPFLFQPQKKGMESIHAQNNDITVGESRQHANAWFC